MKYFIGFITMIAVTLGAGYFKSSYAQGSVSAEQATEIILEKVFDEAERTVIEEYYGQVNKHLKDKDHKDKDDKGKKEKKKDKEKASMKGKGKGKKDADASSKQMPPGLANKETLPPGLANHIEKHGSLPPGLEKRDLPSDLLRRLPPAKKGTRRAVVGNDVVLIEEGTEIVLDILRGVVNSGN
jgi:hypothetical protein